MTGAVRWVLAVILAFSGGAKLLYPDTTRRTLEQSGMIHGVWIAPIAHGVPLLEIAVALGMASTRSPLFPLAAAFLGLCLVGFHACLAWLGQIVPCNCIGSLAIVFDTRALNAAMAFASAMLALGGVALAFGTPPHGRTHAGA